MEDWELDILDKKAQRGTIVGKKPPKYVSPVYFKFDNNMILCVLKWGRNVKTAYSLCCEGDMFNPDTGKQLAFKKALESSR